MSLPSLSSSATRKRLVIPVGRGSQAQHNHSGALSPALISHTTQLALDRLEAQPDGHYQLFALLTRNSIADGALHIRSFQGKNAYYGQEVKVLGGESARLTIRARLNEQSEYDIIGIDLHLISSEQTESLNLSNPPAMTNDDIPSEQLPISGQWLAQCGGVQLAQPMTLQNDLQVFSGTSLPSGASTSTQSMVFSHDGWAAGASSDIPGAHRTHAARTANFEPYPASSSRTRGSAPEKAPDNPAQTVPQGKRPKRPGATDDQIRAHMRNSDGELKTRKAVVKALHAAGLGANTTRLSALRQRETRLRPADEEVGRQIQNHNRHRHRHRHRQHYACLRMADRGSAHQFPAAQRARP
ncbi:hypothetical protein [Pseudomonas rossensis]|uniref:hypothetical protein n=1 Tax=Pseudomonas rossensis TaxID=2305471 RepID=UPI0032612322